MKYIHLFSLLLTFCCASQLGAQNLQLTDSAKDLGFEVYLMPGISPSGEKIFKFSFARLSTYKGHVSRDSIVLSSASGKMVNMLSPVKSSVASENSRSRIFALSAADVGLLKSEDIETMILFINGQRQSVPITKANATALKSLAKKHF